MNKTSKNPKQQKVDKSNSLEVLNELESIGKSVSKQILAEAKSIPGEFVDQLFGVNSQAKYSGEISPGEAVEFSEIWDNQQQERKRAGIQIRLERKFLEEERIRVERKTNELKIELKLIQEELLVLAENTQGLAEETQIAAMQSPIEPGLYHVIFFEKLLEFIKSFVKKVEEASVWLHALNKRSAKKNVWGANYKKFGAKYLLSGEHYLQRSAG